MLPAPFSRLVAAAMIVMKGWLAAWCRSELRHGLSQWEWLKWRVSQNDGQILHPITCTGFRKKSAI